MFWNITADNWALLWSAVIGAIIAGGSAAAVAMVVLKKTREDQYALAKTQLEEQRNDLEKQLTKQQESLELQLREQRQEASKARELAAIAELLSGAMAMATEQAPDHKGLIEAKDRMKSAALRWGLENDDPGMSREVVLWVLALFGQACAVIEAYRYSAKVRDERDGTFNATYAVFMNIWTEYPTASDDTREENWEWMRAAVNDPKPRTNDEGMALRVESAKKVWRSKTSKGSDAP